MLQNEKMEIRKKKHAQHVNLHFQVIGFGWEPVRCIFFILFFFLLPVVFEGARMCQGVLGFYSGAVPLETGKYLTQ